MAFKVIFFSIIIVVVDFGKALLMKLDYLAYLRIFQNALRYARRLSYMFTVGSAHSLKLLSLFSMQNRSSATACKCRA